MSKVVVNVNNRKSRTGTQSSANQMFNEIKKSRREKNRRMLSEYDRKVKKIVGSK